MPRIDPRLWRPLFDAIYEINTARDHADFATAALAALSRLIPADFCHLHAIDRAAGHMLRCSSPHSPYNDGELAYYIAHPQDNPLVAHYERTRDTHARRMSDVIDLRVFRRSEFYQRCLQRVGINHTLALPITVNAGTVAGIAFDRRQRDFTPRHCALLDAFAPHFRLAWRQHADPWRERLDSKPSVRERLRQLGLTTREADILLWMTEGKQNREIATILGRTLDTVQEHVGNVIRKLGQENRHAATVFALRQLNLP